MRTVLSVALALTLALPATTCAGYRAPNGELVSTIPQGADSSKYVAAKIPHRPLEDFSVKELSSWLTLVAYLWPLLLLAAVAWWPGFRMHWTFFVLALGLPLASSCWIGLVVAVGDIAYGALLSFAILAALFALGVAELLARNRRRPSVHR
ncbi:MAG: hypothetical protein ACREN6_14775 [Gemmatimonadaceae bacterium]